MIKTRIPIIVVSALAIISSLTSHANGAFVFNVSQNGPYVLVNGSGTLNLSSLALLGSSAAYAEIEANGPLFFGGPTQSTPYQGYANVAGPTNLGGSTYLSPQGATTGSGSLVGIVVGVLEVPKGYVSGGFLFDTDMYTAPSFAALDLVPGSYVYNWGSGPTADSLTINIGTVREPASLAMLGVPAALALLRRRRGGFAGGRHV